MIRVQLIWTFCLSALSVFGEVIVWDGSKDHRLIGNHLEILEDPSGELTIQEVSSSGYSSRFNPSDNIILNFGFTESVYWLRFKLSNQTDQELRLEIAHATIPIAELYYQQEPGIFDKMTAGYQIPVNDRIVKHHFQVFPLPRQANEFYVRVISNANPLPIKLYEKGDHEIKSGEQRMIYGFYWGLMIFVVISNLFFYFSLRNRLHLFYAVIVILYIAYASVVMDGFILYLIDHVDLMFWYVNIPEIGVTLQTIYALYFLETNRFTPRLHRHTWWLIYYFIAYFILKFFLPATFVYAMNTVHALISFFVMFYLGYRTSKNGNRLGYYFALAYLIYFILVVIEATYIQIGAPKYLAHLSHVSYATLLEAFILSFLLSKRFEWERRDAEDAKKEADAKLIQETREKERIIREQNVVLEERVTERTRELNNSLEDLQRTQLQLIQSEKLASLGELTAGIAHEIQNPLNFVNNFSEVNEELVDEMREELKNGNIQKVDRILEDLMKNEQKIKQHGKRAESIVKNMLQHSHSGGGEKELVDINQLCEEYLRLAYHGMRAKDKTFNVKMETDLGESNPKILVFRQEIGRVLLNLMTNAFYAVQRKKDLGTDKNYVPSIQIKTGTTKGHLLVSIADNGIGIPVDVREKIFQPFFTTKPTGQGTGLGLSLAYEIVTKGHGGSIEVETSPGEGSKFTVQLPIPSSI